MASQGLPLFMPLCALSFLLLLSVTCSKTLHSNVSDIEANDHLEMVTKATPPSPFTHHNLALQRPPSLCKSRTCKRGFTAPKRFAIHGLWPSYDDGRDSPTFCNPNDKFDFGQVLKIAKDLDLAWPSLFESKTQQAFLGNEWAKHGTCSGLTQYQYFKGALDLMGAVNVLNRLKEIKYGPDPKKTYNPSDIITAYEKKYKLKIKLMCVKQRRIGEIQFRVNKITMAVESITGTTTSCTKTKVSFHDK